MQVHRSSLVLGGAALAVSLVSAAIGALAALSYKSDREKLKTKESKVITHEQACGKVWQCIGGALQASQMYLGDRLNLYSKLRELNASTTAAELASETGLHVRWVSEWCAQQASMGILELLPGPDDSSLRFILPKAYCDVLANPESPHYDISMIQAVPALVNRARTSMPECFRTGRGLPYNESDVASAIDRQHTVQIRDVVLPKVVPKARDGLVHAQLVQGVRVAELGCGGGNLLIAMARTYEKSTFIGFEVSDEALVLAKVFQPRHSHHAC